MKQLLSIFALITLLSTSCSKTNYDDHNKPKYLYEIKIMEAEINPLTGNYNVFTLKNKSRYNEKGNMIYDNIPYWSDITKWWEDFETYYKYNSNNQLIEKAHLSSVTKYTYDNSTFLIEERHYVGLLEKSVITYSYGGGRIIKNDEYDVSLDRRYYTNYEYNTQGLLSKKSKYEKTNNNFYSADTYEYDNHSNIIIAHHWYSLTNSYKTTNLNYTYNSDGSINTITDLGADVYFDGVQKKSTYFYNEEKQLIKIETTDLRSGNPISVQTVEYLYKDL